MGLLVYEKVVHLHPKSSRKQLKGLKLEDWMGNTESRDENLSLVFHVASMENGLKGFSANPVADGQ